MSSPLLRSAQGGTKLTSYDALLACRHPLHLHTNPMQIVGLDDAYLQPNTTWSSWFEVRHSASCIYSGRIQCLTWRQHRGLLPTP